MTGTPVPGPTGMLAPVAELRGDPAIPKPAAGGWATGRVGGTVPDPAPLARFGSGTCRW